MNSRRRGEDLLPRLAPIPRTIRQPRPNAGPGRGRQFAPDLIRRVTALSATVLAALSRGLAVLPVLEILGLAVLIYLFAR